MSENRYSPYWLSGHSAELPQGERLDANLRAESTCSVKLVRSRGLRSASRRPRSCRTRECTAEANCAELRLRRNSAVTALRAAAVLSASASTVQDTLKVPSGGGTGVRLRNRITCAAGARITVGTHAFSRTVIMCWAFPPPNPPDCWYQKELTCCPASVVVSTWVAVPSPRIG